MFKSIFTALKMKKPQTGISEDLVIWRDSVAAGDDVFAPHEIKIKVENNEQIDSTVKEILAIRYLPSIQGGKATWILVGKNPVAVIAQQWSKPHFLVKKTTRTAELIKSTGDHQLEFRYWCQVEPNKVVESIVQGKPWPDRYGRDTGSG